MNLPDFLIIGAMKCGTSTLQAQLAVQEGVFMTTPKEPNFFSNDEIYKRGLDNYCALFDAAKNGDLRGEASTHYTKLPTYPKTIKRMIKVLKSPKLVYMIRNPVERAVSHYIHDWSEGRMGHDPEYAFAQHPELIEYGCYAMQIQPYIDAYGIEDIYLTSLESIRTEPFAELGRIGRFLGLENPAIWQSELPTQNVSAKRIRRFPLHGLLVDNQAARTLRHLLVPKALRTRIREARTIGSRPELSDKLRTSLQQAFTQDHAKLSKQFTNHAALDDCYPFLAA
jgi:hypothetical protein